MIRPIPAPWQGAMLALLAGLLMQVAFVVRAADPTALALRPSVELSTAPPGTTEAPPNPVDDGLALRESRELALPTAVPVSAVRTAQADNEVQFEVLAAFALFLFACIVALLASSLVARWSRVTGDAREERFRKRWEPVLYARMAGDDIPLPALAASEQVALLKVWLHVLGYVRGEEVEGLVALANELDLGARAMALFESSEPHERLVAMRVAAALGLKEAIAPLREAVLRPKSKSAFDAAAALLKISPPEGLAAVRDLLARVDWAPGAVVGMLKDGGGEGTTRMLAELLATMPAGGGTPVLRLIGLLDDYSALPVFLERLRATSDEQEIAVILHALGRLGGAGERDVVLAYLGHPGWLVRMQAAVALGELGLGEDTERLWPLLGDPQWWVRYRAAQSLLKLGGAEAVRRAGAATSDRFAHDILERVQAE